MAFLQIFCRAFIFLLRFASTRPQSPRFSSYFINLERNLDRLEIILPLQQFTTLTAWASIIYFSILFILTGIGLQSTLIGVRFAVRCTDWIVNKWACSLAFTPCFTINHDTTSKLTNCYVTNVQW